jgi:hypothetical protein
MPYQPPINRRELQRAGLLDEDQFYAELAAEAGMDIETVKQVYLAQVRVINRKLFDKFVCRLPHLGDFSLRMGAGRSVLIGKDRKNIPPKRTLKFYALDKWVNHINKKLGYLKDYWS